jgi:hypothetical protein
VHPLFGTRLGVGGDVIQPVSIAFGLAALGDVGVDRIARRLLLSRGVDRVDVDGAFRNRKVRRPVAVSCSISALSRSPAAAAAVRS